MTLLRLAVAAACVLGLLAAGGWLLLDSSATGIARNELAALGLRPYVALERVELPEPGLVRAHGLVLRDPDSGSDVAALDLLELQLALGSSWSSPRLAGLRGRGGRASFEHDGRDVPFIRALQALLERLGHHGPRTPEEAAAPPPALPPLEFREVDAVLRVPGQPLREYRDCLVWVQVTGHDTRVDIAIGRDGGRVRLDFAAGGLRRVEVQGVAVDPAGAVFLPAEVQPLAAALAPSGTLDLALDLDPFDPRAARASGLLRGAGLRPARLPFALQEASLPFALEGGRVQVRDAQLDFPGGRLRASLEADAHGSVLELQTEGAAFRREFLQLIPQWDQVTWLAPEDGGRFDLRLRIASAGGATEVDGWGGLAIERLRVGRTGVLVEDVVGSLEVHDQVLSFHELTGRCSGGAARLAGTLDLRSGEVVADAAVFDVDVARLDRALEMPGAEQRRMAGFLQGDLHWQGRLGEPALARGKGQFSLRGGYLWRVPVLDAVLRALSVATPEEQRSDALSIAFRQRGTSWQLDEIRLDSPYLALRGKGKVHRGGELDVQITPIAAGGTVGDALRYLQKQLVLLELRGTWDQPQVRLVPLKAVTGPVGDFLDWVGGLFGA